MMKHTPITDAAARLRRDERTVSDNLDDIHSRLCRMLACSYIQTEAQADLYARASIPHFSDNETAEAAETDAYPHLWPNKLREALYNEFVPSSDVVLPAHDSLLRHACRQLSVTEQMCLYRSLLSDSDNRIDVATLAARLLGHVEAIESFAAGKIVYQHNIYTDEAFLRFARVLPTARATYAESFTAVCEQVFDGQCEYCILPLENTQDGKLMRFYGLIEKYELKITLTCTVTTSDNRHSTVFGLCRRGISWPQLLLHDRGVCFEFLFFREAEHLSLGTLLCAAECASLSLLRADCLPRSDEEILMGTGYPFDLCLEPASRGETDSSFERDLLAFLLFLSVHSPTYLPLGIYQQI